MLNPTKDTTNLVSRWKGGYYFTPDLRIGLGYAFGVDDRDFTGYRSNGGLYLNISFKVNEFFGGFGRQKVVPRQQQESEVKTVTEKPKVNTTLEVFSQ
ncbi:hypothetical protein NIES4075_16670 [Tolypothrix sp. NIES-4075]|uniref:hypothetical protein n=1 Tax=Tolypothrix sp. NIES-4075 TaxID=2005459 RepID=UPI000B65FE59|nr:hypothetical protein NIES4075_16670 [Tolypothrix sp. NIES-4075]